VATAIDGPQSLIVDGRQRSYLLDVPKNLGAGAGLILVCHGFGDSPESIRDYSGFHKLVDEHHFVFAYLEGTRDRERKRNHQVEYAFQDPKIDDIKYARHVVEKLVRQFHLDPTRVFCTGMSNGADFSYYLARQTRPFVRAIAPVAGCMMAVWDRHLTRQSRMAVMEVHGTADEVTLWQGDMANHDGWGAYLGTEAVAKWWVEALGLKMLEQREEGGISLKRWWTDSDRSEYRLYTIPGGKHVWPERLGNPERTLAQEIVAFFEQHGGS
jgi:polyhydroxybutyrate depolymerase